MILLEVFPIPIGRTPGFLSRAIRRLLSKGNKAAGSTNEVQMRLATKAREWHKSTEAEWNDVQRRRKPQASTPDGPAAPSIRSATRRITSSLRQSNTTEWQ